MADFIVKPVSLNKPKASKRQHAAQVETFTGPAPQGSEPSNDDIARRAYEIYDKSGRQPGHCRQNWEQAERELRRNSGTTDSGEQQQTSLVDRIGPEPVVVPTVKVMPSKKGGNGSKRDGALQASRAGRHTKS